MSSRIPSVRTWDKTHLLRSTSAGDLGAKVASIEADVLNVLSSKRLMAKLYRD